MYIARLFIIVLLKNKRKLFVTVASFYTGHLPDIWRLEKEADGDVSLPVTVDFW